MQKERVKISQGETLWYTVFLFQHVYLTLDLHCSSLNCKMSDSWMVPLGVAIIKTISRNLSIKEFVLCNHDGSDGVIQDILQRLTTDEQRRFTTGRYDNDPCICLSPSSEY